MIYMFLADGFEEVEALCPLDLMRRAGLSVTTVGVGKKNIVGAHGITVLADISEDEFSSEDMEMVFLPGGMPGTLNLAASKTVMDAIAYAYNNDLYISAICAAPSILGDMGMLNGKEAICYPGFEDRLKGAIISDKKVVRSGKIITAAGMGVALEMGLFIIETLISKEISDKIRMAVIAK